MNREPADTFCGRVGQAIARQRRLRGWTQTKLARLSGLSLKYVGEVERGEANVSASSLQQLFTAMNWHPFLTTHDPRESLPTGLRELLRRELRNIARLADTASEWLLLDGASSDDEEQPVSLPNDPRPNGE